MFALEMSILNTKWYCSMDTSYIGLTLHSYLINSNAHANSRTESIIIMTTLGNKAIA